MLHRLYSYVIRRKYELNELLGIIARIAIPVLMALYFASHPVVLKLFIEALSADLAPIGRH
jgi:hypothetical protein